MGDITRSRLRRKTLEAGRGKASGTGLRLRAWGKQRKRESSPFEAHNQTARGHLRQDAEAARPPSAPALGAGKNPDGTAPAARTQPAVFEWLRRAELPAPPCPDWFVFVGSSSGLDVASASHGASRSLRLLLQGDGVVI